MEFFGLNIIDWLIILLYLTGMLYIGQRLAKTIKDESDFYLANRGLGKIYQFFLQFGNATDANSAATVTSEVFRQGAGGVWIAFQVLFMTPFLWFTNVWYRRVRLISMGDLFEDRFGGKSLAGLYSCFCLVLATIIIGFAYLAAGKTMQGILVKPESSYTSAEQQMVQDFKDYNHLHNQYSLGTLTGADLERYETLSSLKKKGQLRGFVSYLHGKLWIFYVVYGLTIGIYVMSGGFKAAVVTNVFQGILIIIFSFILIPFGIIKLGGFSGLHASVPDYMFRIVGSVDMSEYTCYTIVAFVFVGFFSNNGHWGNMASGGSAKDEYTARVGLVTGCFAKRFMIIAWVICGLIGAGLYSGQIADPDETWGTLTKGLLSPGAIGLMVIGILAANMSSVDAQSINISALFVRNLYTPLFPNKSEKHYILVGRFVIVAILGAGMIVAMYSRGIISLLKVMSSFPAIFGTAVVLMFFWRRITKTAIILEVIVSFIVIGILPTLVPNVEFLRKHPALTVQTPEQTITKEVIATEADIAGGLAQQAGQKFTKTLTIQPASVYFDSVAHVDPMDLNSPLEGVGRFHAEIYVTGLVGIPVESFSKAGLLATRFAFTGIFPLVLLILFSYVTKQPNKQLIDRFYAKMKTPVAANLEQDAVEMEKSYADPTRFDHLKIFPNSKWEFCKWTLQDTVGFVLSWIGVGVVIIVFWMMVTIGS